MPPRTRLAARVQAKTRSVPDWRNAEAYAPLVQADRSLLAWEWLRRDPRYIEAQAQAGLAPPLRSRHSAARFGLVDFEPADRSVPEARPLWTATIHPYVLAVAADPGGAPEDSLDVERFADIAARIEGQTNDHLLLCDGFRTVRLDGPPGTFAGGPRRLRYLLNGIAAAQRPLLTLRRLLALCSTGRFAPTLHRPQPRSRRWVLMLRAYDAILAGANQREIAGVLLSRTAVEPRWRSRESSVRSQAQRLVRSARDFAERGYRSLLS